SKVWTFNNGLSTTYEERDNTNTALLHKDYTWTVDAAGNIYIGTAVTTLNPGTAYAAQSKTSQMLDIYYNVTLTKIYDYGNLSTPARTYDSVYLSYANYTSRYIRNRLTSATVTVGGSTTTLVTNYYDGAGPSSCGGLQNQTVARLHDST